MGGDLLWHDTVWQSAAADARGGAAYDFDPMFADVRPLIEGADLALCHEEVPFAAPGAPLQSYPVFAAPPEIAPWIASMGWDACTTASNHALDQGFDGLVRTRPTCWSPSGVRHVGTFRTARERRQPVVLTTRPACGWAWSPGTYGLNGFPLPEGREWSVSMLDVPDLLRQARAARRAGADVVVVHLHAGYEYDELPSPEQVAAVERLTRSPLRRPGARRARAHGPADHPGQRQVGRLRHGQPGRPAGGHPAGDLPRHPGPLHVRRATGRRRSTVRRAAYVPVGWNKASAPATRSGSAGLDDPGDRRRAARRRRERPGRSPAVNGA